MFAAAQVAQGQICKSEVQSRLCDGSGNWGAWSGTFAAPTCAPQVGVCNLDNYTVPINLVGQSNTPKGKWWENTATFTLPADAQQIQLAIKDMFADDNSPRVWINDSLVLDLDEENDDMEVHTLHLNVDVSAALKGGVNTVRGRVFDRYGVYATLFFKLSGTYKTGQACAVTVE